MSRNLSKNLKSLAPGRMEGVGLLPSGSGFILWAKERFPLMNVVAAFVMYFMAFGVIKNGGSFESIKSFFEHMSGELKVSWMDILAACALTGQFLLLRVLDEHKDFDQDSVNHPERALQKGLITLPQLKLLGGAAVVSGLGISLKVDFQEAQVGLHFGATLAWGLLMTWTYLMSVEFFCVGWIRKRITLYAFSHMMIVPFMMIWVLKLVNPQGQVNRAYFLMLILTFLSGFAYELTRKTRGNDENPQLDSYTKAFGVKGSALIIGAVLTGVGAVQVSLLKLLNEDLAAGPMVASTLAFGLSLFSLVQFIKKPTTKSRKKNEALIGLFMLSNYIAVIHVSFSQFASPLLWPWSPSGLMR